MGRRRIIRRRRDAPIAIRDFLDQIIARMGGKPGRERLARLWSEWDLAIGPELSQQARPMGTRGDTLVIRADNAMHMQELQFHLETILTLVNEYLGSPYFKNIRLSIYETGKNCSPSNESKRKNAAHPIRKKSGRAKGDLPQITGKYLASMDKSSPVARCYAAFASK